MPLGKIHAALGMEFFHDRNEGKLKITQTRYIEHSLKSFDMEKAKPVKTPLEANVKLTKPDTPSLEIMKKFPYQELIGTLMYLAVATRPDISFAVSFLSQFNTCYEERHWTAAKRVLRYLKGTSDMGITFKKNNKYLEGFADADWASCTMDRRSYTGYVFTLANGAISWEARKQRTVALSSTEAEYMSLTEACKEAVHLDAFMKELGLEGRLKLYADNQGAIKLSNNPMFHSRTKHIDVRHHFVREVLNEDKLELTYVPTEDMTADIFTKALPCPKFEDCRMKMGLVGSSLRGSVGKETS